MKVLIVGNGGREHALLWKMARDDPSARFYITGGNGGTGSLAEPVPISPSDIEALVRFAGDEAIDLTVVGPELPLSLGIVDRFEEAGLPIFGPSREAARLETSKAFAKDLMRKEGVPTADSVTFREFEAAKAYVLGCASPVVVKASGLAAGKGAIVCGSREEAIEALEGIMVDRAFGEAGDVVIVEECMRGEELSIFCLTDGERILPMVPSQDHKPVYDGDRGPNTGGMGAYAPVSIADAALQERVRREVFEPVIRAMAERGTPYRGLLYAGLMLTTEGPKVVEFNARFGDPETQVVLPLLEDDLIGLLGSVAAGKLEADALSWRDGTAVVVVLASEGYPGGYEKGKAIEIDEALGGMTDVVLFHAGTEMDGDVLRTSGGRVLGVTALGGDIGDAIDRAYAACDAIRFEGKYHRTDIGKKDRDRIGGATPS
jgi:phosphoribosylamine--glycine ligase